MGNAYLKENKKASEDERESFRAFFDEDTCAHTAH